MRKQIKPKEVAEHLYIAYPYHFDGWLICNGQSINPELHKKLLEVLNKWNH